MSFRKTVLLFLLLGIAWSAEIRAQTLLEAGYFSRNINGVTVDRPEASWENPGSLSTLTRFCLYRSETGPNPDITNRLSYWITWPPSTWNDDPFADDDYSYLTTSGFLEYWGVRGNNCHTNATGAGLTPTTTVARAVPNIGIMAANPQGTQVDLVLTKYTDYAGVFIWALGNGLEPINLGFSVNPQAGITPLSFTLGAGAGQVNLPVDHTYQFGVTGVLAGGNVTAPPTPLGYAAPQSLSSRLVIAGEVAIYLPPVTLLPPNPPANLQIQTEGVADLLLTWANDPEPYAEIIVYQDGAEVDRLAGDQTEKRFANHPFGQVSTFELEAVHSNGVLTSTRVGITLTDPPLPQPPQGILFHHEDQPLQMQLEIIAPAQADLYIGVNQILGYLVSVQSADGFTNLDLFSENPTLSLTLEPGIYQVAAQTLTSPNGTPVLSDHTPPFTTTVLPQPPEPVPMPVVIATVDPSQPYQVFLFLDSPAEGSYDRVEIRDAQTQTLLTTLTAEMGWQAYVAVSQAGTLTWSAQGFHGSAFSEPFQLQIFMPLQTPDFWYWINDEDANGVRTEAVAGLNNGRGAARHIHLKIAPNLPAGNPVNEDRRIVVEVWSAVNNQSFAESDPLEGSYTALVLSPNLVSGSPVYYTHSLPANHMLSGSQFLKIHTQITNGNGVIHSSTNIAKFSVGVRYGYFRNGTTEVLIGDVDNNDKIDVRDIQATEAWYVSGTLANRPACLETLNRDGDAYIPLPLLNTPPPRKLYADPLSQSCDGDSTPESTEDLTRLRTTRYQTHVPAEEYLQGERGKPRGFNSSVIASPIAQCNYNRYADPAHPVFNQLQGIYPTADAYCRFGPYETEAQAKPGNQNGHTTPEPPANNPPSSSLDAADVSASTLYLNSLMHNTTLAASVKTMGAILDVDFVPPPISGGPPTSGSGQRRCKGTNTSPGGDGPLMPSADILGGTCNSAQ